MQLQVIVLYYYITPKCMQPADVTTPSGNVYYTYLQYTCLAAPLFVDNGRPTTATAGHLGLAHTTAEESALPTASIV